MNRYIIMNSIILVGVLSIFSGCAKSVTCKAPDNSEIRVSVLEDSYDPEIVTYRWNPFFGGWFNTMPTEGFSFDSQQNSNVITANMTYPALFTIWGAKRIKLDANTNTVRLGEDSYTCQDDVSVLTNLVKKIQKEKTQDRMRALISN